MVSKGFGPASPRIKKKIKMWCRSVELCFEKREIDALLNVIMWPKLCGFIIKLVMLWCVLTGAMTRVGRNLPGI